MPKTNEKEKKANSGGSGRKAVVVGEGFGEVLYSLMLARRTPKRIAWGAKELAGASGISVGTIRNYLAGTVAPSEVFLRALARVLGAVEDELVATSQDANISHISTVSAPNPVNMEVYGREATAVAVAVYSRVAAMVGLEADFDPERHSEGDEKSQDPQNKKNSGGPDGNS